MNGWLMLSAFPLTPPQPLAQQPVEPLPVHSPHDHRFRRALRHAPPVGDGHAGGVFAIRPDLGVDVAGVEEGGLGEAGDHLRIVQGASSLLYLAVSRRSIKLVREATGWRTGGPERCSSFPQARGVGALWMTSGGITARGRPERKAICAASGSAQMLNPAAG